MLKNLGSFFLFQKWSRESGSVGGCKIYSFLQECHTTENQDGQVIRWATVILFNRFLHLWSTCLTNRGNPWRVILISSLYLSSATLTCQHDLVDHFTCVLSFWRLLCTCAFYNLDVLSLQFQLHPPLILIMISSLSFFRPLKKYIF